MTEEPAPLLPSRSREGSGVGTVAGVRRPTNHAQRLRREATPAERALWRHLRGGQLGVRFSRQMPVGPFICDFLCRSHRLAIELDGESHTATVHHDRRRSAFIAAQGIHIVRFTNADVMTNADGVVLAIRQALAAHAHPQPLPQAGGEPG